MTKQAKASCSFLLELDFGKTNMKILTVIILMITVASYAQKDGLPLKPPRGSVVLFDGKNTSAWIQRGDGKPCQWVIEDGALVVTPRTSDILTKEKFSDFQLHVEFNLPILPDNVKDQARGNSGVYMLGLYEIQVLDSFNNGTYADGMCGAIYKQKPPDINACKPAGEWQSYDITFRAPRFDKDGKMTEKPRVTVFHNGIKIHDNVEIRIGPTTSSLGGPEVTSGPILLQNHGNAVKYRNVWIKPLKMR